MKALTRNQVTTRKEQAERFVRDVLGDDERAEEIAEESVDDYAERRRFRITNPHRRRKPHMPSKQEMQERIRELEAENEELTDKLDSIAELVSPEDEEEEEEGEDDEFDQD